MLDKVVRALRTQPGVDDWLVRLVRKTSTQYYTIGARPESRREVDSEHAVVTVMNDHPGAREAEGIKRGEAQLTVLPTDLARLPEKLEEAVFMASLTDNPPYEPAQPASYPEVDLVDREIQSEPHQVAERLVAQLIQALAGEKNVRLSSAEVFLETSHIALANSRGASGEQLRTDLLVDFVLLASGRDNEMESHIALERCRTADLDMAKLARQQAQYARDAIAAGTPRTGVFPVLISDEALAELFMSGGESPLVFRSSAQIKYQQLTTWKVGQSVLLAEPTGDPFTMYSDTLVPFGTRSGRFDHDGLPGQRTVIVENGVLRRLWASNRYAQYLGIDASGTFGNMELATGSTPYIDLQDDAEPLYHIVAFSAMSPDPITGDFVGEIRLGYELEDGHRRPIRGGSISGNLLAALAGAKLSQERTFLGDYVGPRAMRLPQITVAGA